MKKKIFFSGIIGNILEHYDTALFGFLAPFIAPLFFDREDPLTALILTYAILPLGIFTRPLGAFCFGRIADRHGRQRALSWSLSGMAVATVTIGCLPTAQEIGVLAPILLAAMRLIQSFFAAGETVGGALYVLEHTDESKHSFVSSVYDASTIGGIFMASGFVTCLSMQNGVEEGWRYLFWFGGLTAVLGVFLRVPHGLGYERSTMLSHYKEGKEQGDVQVVCSTAIFKFKELYMYRRAFVSVVCAAGFSYMTYALPFTLMNGYIPLVTGLAKADLMKVNTAFLGVDLCLLPIFGYLGIRLGKERMMLWGVVSLACFATSLFIYLGPSSTLFFVSVFRMLIVLSGIAFAAPYHAWAMEGIPERSRAVILCLGYSVGSQVIGSPTAAMGLFAYQQTGWVGAPLFYILPVTVGAFLSLRMKCRN